MALGERSAPRRTSGHPIRAAWSGRACCRLGAGSGHPTVLAPDQVEGPGIDEDSRPLTEDKDGIQAVEGVGEQRQATKDREEPERYRDHALLPLLRGNPLDEEPHGEEGLAEKPVRQPDLLVAHRARPRVAPKFGAPPIP